MQEAHTEPILTAYREFLNTSLNETLSRHQQTAPEQAVLELFHRTSRTVPAYRAFLSEQGIEPETIRTHGDFHRLPTLTKQNYLLRYPLPDLCRNGRIEACDMMAVSSGSTGTPCFWPRFVTDELQIAARFEQVFLDSFQVDKRRTLAVVCFALGTWVGGMYTTDCCRHLATKGYPITVVTPGTNRAEIYRVVQELGPLFDQVVLLGYPPFLKGIIDEGRAQGLDWTPHHIKLVMAGEVFSEEWRSLVAERIGSRNPRLDFAALYGTADAGVLGNETPISITIRRWLSQHPEAARELFGESRLPTLVQYDPNSRYFEAQERSLLFTGDNGIPLIRYNILDTGGVLTYSEMTDFLQAHGFDPLAALEAGAPGTTVRELPFVYVFGRSDFTVSYFGANIYPENVTVGLEQDAVKDCVTGKFVLQAVEDADRNRYLSVVVELAPGVEAEEHRKKVIAASLRTHLLRLNSEFASYVPAESQLPVVTLAPTGDPEYFPAGVKHRYTRR